MSTHKMPALFIGHGTPMNALDDNVYTRAWAKLGSRLPRPKAILAISAHWYIPATAVTAMAFPKTIHDFGGFPDSLFQVQYPAVGSPELAQRVSDLLSPIPVLQDQGEWGLDHGTWEILLQMYPEADIPVIQLSIDSTQSVKYHYDLGKKLAVLRQEGVLILASGNVVHNLRAMNWRDPQVEPYPWASSFDQYVREQLASQQQPHPLIYALAREDGQLSNPSPEHFLPLLYILGTREADDPISLPVEGITFASLSMMSVMIG